MITLVNTKEAAKILGLSVRHVRKLLKTGVLQGQKIGRDWLMFQPAGEYKKEGK